MTCPVFADISFFNSVGQNGGGSFVWTNNAGDLSDALDTNTDLSPYQDAFSQIQDEKASADKTVDPLEKLATAVDKNSKKRDIWRILRTLGLMGALTVGTSVGQLELVKHLYPEDYAARQQEVTSVGQQFLDWFNHPFYYSMLMRDHPNTAHIDLLRRVAEAKVVGPGLGIALSYLFREIKKMRWFKGKTKPGETPKLTKHQQRQIQEIDSAFKNNDFSKVGKYITRNDLELARAIAAYSPRLTEGLDLLSANIEGKQEGKPNNQGEASTQPPKSPPKQKKNSAGSIVRNIRFGVAGY